MNEMLSPEVSSVSSH